MSYSSLKRFRTRGNSNGSGKKNSHSAAGLSPVEEKCQTSLADKSELFSAVIRGDEETVIKLIEYNGIDVNTTDNNYLTALHYAAMYTRPLLIQYLIQRGANVDSYDMKGGFTPLHWIVINSVRGAATTTGSNQYEEQRIDDCIMYLARGGCNINCKDFNQATPLHMAARTDNKQIIDILMRLGADPNEIDVLGRTCTAVAKSSTTKILIIKLADMKARALYHTLDIPTVL